MKNLHRIVLFTLLVLAQDLGAQDTILVLRELTNANRAPIPIAQRGLPIVDINSRLEIQPNATAIQTAAQQRFPQFFKDKLLKDKAARIENLLKNQLRIIELTQQLVDGMAVGVELRKQLREYIKKVKDDPLLREDYNHYINEFDQQFADAANPPDPFIYSIGRFNDQLNEISGNLKKFGPDNQVQFSVAAFRRDAQGGGRIHVENFDELQNGDFYSVPRFVTTLSPNDRQQLDNYRQLADSLNKNAAQVLTAYKTKLLETFPSVECARQIPAELDGAITVASDSLKIILQAFKTGETEQILNTFNSLIADIRNWPPTQAPNWPARLDAFLALLDSSGQHFDGLLQDISELAANSHVLKIKDCFAKTRKDFKTIQQFVNQFPANYLNKVSLASEDLAAEIRAFDLNDIPPVGLIDLEYSGPRKPGDEILIKAVFRLPNDSSASRNTGHAIEVHRLKMILVGAHSITKVGLIMANPYTLTAQQPDKPKFRFAPSAALLLKFGSRKSHFYNNFFDPGIGLNTAAPDFNLDGTPEFSAGVTATILRDILSVGWNWNFGLDRPNYFIGIHLPFNLPGVPVNTIQNNPLPEN